MMSPSIIIIILIIFGLWIITTPVTLTPFSVLVFLTLTPLPFLALDTLALVSPTPMGLISLAQTLRVLTLSACLWPLY